MIGASLSSAQAFWSTQEESLFLQQGSISNRHLVINTCLAAMSYEPRCSRLTISKAFLGYFFILLLGVAQEVK